MCSDLENVHKTVHCYYQNRLQTIVIIFICNVTVATQSCIDYQKHVKSASAVCACWGGGGDILTCERGELREKRLTYV